MTIAAVRMTTSHFFSAGTRCDAVLWEPAKPPDAPGPGLVLCHGFRGIKEWLLPAFAEAFAAAGLTVLTFDYRGFGASEGQRGRLIPAEQVEDIRSALTFLSLQNGVDPQRMALYGTSFGGANVIQAAALDERVAAVVAQVALGDVRRAWRDPMAAERWARLQRLIETDRADRTRGAPSQTIDPAEILVNEQSQAAFAAAEQAFPQIRTAFPLEAVERIFEFAPERVIAQIAPRAVLLLGAARDLAVPVAETEQLYAAAREPKRMEIFDITHYEIYESPYRERAVALALELFGQHLTGAAIQRGGR